MFLANYPWKLLFSEHTTCRRQASIRGCTKSARQRFRTQDQDVSYLKHHLTTWPHETYITAGTNRRGRVCTMSRRMAKSTSQQDFFGTLSMHYIANQSTTAFDETQEDLFHDHHLDRQERMQNPIAFHAEMMVTSCTTTGHFNNQMQSNSPTS